MLVFPNTVPSDFVYKFLPKFIYNMIATSVNVHKFDAMDDYMKKLGINHSTVDLIKFSLDNLEIKEVNGVYMIQVSTKIKIKDYTLNQLMRLVDSGNLEVKGTNVMTDASNYINSHRGTVLEAYMGG